MLNNLYFGIVYDVYILIVREMFKGYLVFEFYWYVVVEFYIFLFFGFCVVNLVKGYYILIGIFFGGNLYIKFCNL